MCTYIYYVYFYQSLIILSSNQLEQIKIANMRGLRVTITLPYSMKTY